MAYLYGKAILDCFSLSTCTSFQVTSDDHVTEVLKWKSNQAAPTVKVVRVAAMLDITIGPGMFLVKYVYILLLRGLLASLCTALLDMKRANFSY